MKIMTFESGQKIQKRCLTLVVLLLSAVFIIIALNNARCLSNDFYFLASSGEEILQAGHIPKIFSHQMRDAPVYYQQWLYTVYCAFLSHIGMSAVVISNIVQALSLTFLMYWLCRLRKCAPLLSVLTPCFSLMLFREYLVNVRPECITIILLAMQLIAVEKYQQAKKWQWLLVFPVVGILESNLHATMLPMHLVVMIPYCLPFWLGKYYPYTKPEIDIRKFLLPLTGLFAAGCIHPYGPKIYVYLFDCFTNGYNSLITMAEMTSGFRHVFGLAVITTALFISFIRKNISPSAIYMALGLTYASILIIRNGMFLMIVVCYAVSSIGPVDFISSRLEAIRNNSAVYGKTKAEVDAVNIRFQIIWIVFYSICSVALGFLAFGFWSVTWKHYKEASALPIDSPETICDVQIENSRYVVSWLTEHESNKDVIILNHMDEGGYLEFKGFQNVYLDCRPELWNSEKTSPATANQTDTLLEEYSKLFLLDSTLEYFEKHPEVKKQYQHLILSDEQIQKILDTYQVDYIMGYDFQRVVRYASEHPEQFQVAFQCKDKDDHETEVFLYQKIQK